MSKFFLLLLFCITLLSANSQPGSLDSTFGNSGIQETAFPNNLNILNEFGSAVLTSANGDLYVAVNAYNFTRIVKYLPDGRLDFSYGNAGRSIAAYFNSTTIVLQGEKIIVGGYTYVNGNSSENFALARYTANGKLDSSFGKNGMAITDIKGSNDEAFSIALQGDKIIMGGTAENPLTGRSDFALARYTADGVLDTTFGVNGTVTTDFNNSYEGINSIAIDGNKIVAAGYTYNPDTNINDFALARYTADGVLDASFGENGTAVTTDFNNSRDYANSMVLQGDKIVVGGSSNDEPGTTNDDFALVRYTAAGTLDSSFGVNGKVTTDIDNSQNLTSAIALQEDKIILTGFSMGDFALVRYTAAGALDSSFGMNGRVTTDFNTSEDYASALALQGSRIVVAGYTDGYPNYDFAIARYTADGALDDSFGKKGKLTGYFPSARTSFASTVLQGDKMIVAGNAYNPVNSSPDFVLARYMADGTLDSSFAVNGTITTDFNHSEDYAVLVALQGDKIVVAGTTFNAVNGYDFALARYTADGELDASFGEKGKVITDATNVQHSDDFARAVAVQGDKIIVAGSSRDDFVLTRYLANGKLDSSFGVYGKVRTDFHGNSDYATSIVLQGDRILVAGTSNGDFALIRYTTYGRLDASFGKNGKVVTDLNSANDVAYAMALQGSMILLAGTSNDEFALARYTADGALDASFGINGIITTDINSLQDNARSLALQEDKIILGGITSYYTKYHDYANSLALARFTMDGKLDSSFGKHGIVVTNLAGNTNAAAIAVHQNRLYAVGTEYMPTADSYGVIAAYQLEVPEPTISIADLKVSEDKRFAIATVRLSAPTNKVVRVHYTTRDKTAVRNEDYLSISGPLFFVPGVNTTAKIVVPLIDDNQHENNEQFAILLSNAHHATIQDSVAVVTIVDNDDALITKQEDDSLHIKVSPNPSAGAFTVQLQGSNLKKPISIRVYNMSGRLVEERNNINVGRRIQLRNQCNPGSYIIEAVQGNLQVHTTVVKLGK